MESAALWLKQVLELQESSEGDCKYPSYCPYGLHIRKNVRRHLVQVSGPKGEEELGKGKLKFFLIFFFIY